MKTILDLNELLKQKATDEQYMEFLKKISDEEWQGIFKELGPFPFKGKLAKLRKIALQNK